MSLLLPAGLGLVVVAAIAVQLASPHPVRPPRGGRRRHARRAWLLAGLALGPAGTACLLQELQRLTACFLLLTTLMASWVALPHLAALMARGRAR